MNSKVWIVLSVLICGRAVHAPQARAQSFRLNTFRSAERADDGFSVRRIGAFEHLRWGALLTADYAHDPLVIEQTSGDSTELARVVEHHLTLKLDLSLALWNRLIVFAGLEAQPVLSGPNIPSGFALPEADGGGMGDLALGARVRLLGERDDLFALAAQATLIAPTAGSQVYRGEEKVAFRPDVIAELRPGPVRITLNVGSLVRQPQSLLDTQVASQLTYATAVGLRITQQLEALGELWGGLAYKDFAGKTSSPVEWLLGGKYRSDRGVFAGLAAGRGLSHGVGAPDARVVAQLGYLRPESPTKSGSPEQASATPTPAPAPAPRDEDGDGLVDTQDGCPSQAEDRDGFDDGDGCPEPDNDKDGVLDVVDLCPALAGLSAERGCPGKQQVSDESELVVFRQVLFEVNQAQILPESQPDMEAVQRVLSAHPELTRLRIEGHTDSLGQDATNLALSQRRAAAVGSWLVQHGIEESRLEVYGCGERHPITSEQDPASQARNRRVVFQVIEPVPPGQARSEPLAGCVLTPLSE